MPNLQDIIGQDAAVTRLSRAITGSRMPHAFLFAGPVGVGRRTTAMALAGTVLCGNATAGDDDETPRPCGQCDDCRMIEADSHPDLHLIYKELAKYHDDAAVRNRVMQSLGIEVIRQFFLGAASATPARGRSKVFIVLEADLLSIAAQNAMLKTLEEPPAGVLIILICRRAGQMLPTTVSRCSMVRFGPLPRDFVCAKLAEQDSSSSPAPAEAEFWAAYTDGSIGQSLRLSGQGLYEIKCELLNRLAAMGPAGDPELGEHVAKITDKLATEAVAAAKRADGSNMSKMLASRRAAGSMLELLASAFRDAMKLSTGAAVALIHADQRDAIESLANRFEPSQLARVIEQLSEYERILWRNVNPRTVWDNAAITLATAAPLRL